MRMKKRWIIVSVFVIIAVTLSLKVFLNSVYHLPILMYHSIEYTSDKNKRTVVNPEEFERQMKYLHDKGYNVIPIEKAVWYLEMKKKPPRKTVAITLDDGYENNYKFVYPVLKKYHIPATMFVIVNLIGKENFLNWDEIKEMSDSGVIDIESHTSSHPWLTSLSDEALKMELEGSKATLEKALGKREDYLCYPMGKYDERVKSAAKTAGYKAAFATKPTKIFSDYDIYEIRRIRVSSTSNNLFVFAIKLSGYCAFFRTVRSDYKNIPNMIWQKKSL